MEGYYLSIDVDADFSDTAQMRVRIDGVDYFDNTNLSLISYLWFWADSEMLNPNNYQGLKVKGSAIATTIATSSMVIHYIYYLFNSGSKNWIPEARKIRENQFFTGNWIFLCIYWCSCSYF